MKTGRLISVGLILQARKLAATWMARICGCALRGAPMVDSALTRSVTRETRKTTTPNRPCLDAITARRRTRVAHAHARRPPTNGARATRTTWSAATRAGWTRLELFTIRPNRRTRRVRPRPTALATTAARAPCRPNAGLERNPRAARLHEWSSIFRRISLARSTCLFGRVSLRCPWWTSCNCPVPMRINQKARKCQH